MVLATAILSGLPPAWRMVRADVANSLRESGRGLTAGHHRLRAGLVIAQVAVALVLLVAASLLIRSFQRLMEVDPGFDARHLLAIATQVPQAVQKADRRTAFYRRVQDALASVPGVESAALLLAGVGIYGTLSQAVAQRTPEIGLRMALGASPAATVRLVLRQGLTLALIGIVMGAVFAAALTRLMGKMLFEVRPLDPPAFAAATLVLGAFAWLACYLPARRATRVDPLETLRRGT